MTRCSANTRVIECCVFVVFLWRSELEWRALSFPWGLRRFGRIGLIDYLERRPNGSCPNVNEKMLWIGM